MRFIKINGAGKFLLTFLYLITSNVFADDILIAVRAHKGAAQSMERWDATASYLTEKIPQHHFILVPFENIGVMNQAVSRGDFKFVLADPASLLEYKIKYEYEPLATLVNKRQGKGYTKFGSVIFTLAARDDINDLTDLKNKIVMGVDELAFAGWRTAWKEFLNNGIKPYEDFRRIQFAGGIQQEVVFAVRDGKSDAGIVRTDMLEQLVATGEITLADYKVLNIKKSPGFPFLHSTKLYPEWGISSARNLNPAFKNKVKEELYSVEENDQPALKGDYVSWITPLDLSEVDDLLKALKVGPYNVATMNSYKSILNEYGIVIFAVVLIIIFLVVITVYVAKVNKKLVSARDSLRQESELSSKLEKQLLHSQRVESLGQLTGGIAHDFNNMLASIVGFTELSLQAEAVKNDEKLSRYLNHVLTASEKSTALINQMLTFSKSATDDDKALDIPVNKILNEVKDLLQPIVSSGFKLKVNKIDPGLMININPSMFIQVMMNLYLNAKDAITSKTGRLEISAKYFKFDDSETFCNSCHENIVGDYIIISVQDNGDGIESDVTPFIFDPFFSTKDVGKGKGMGLSTVHGIIHKHNGHILVDSKTNVGTVFKLLLPAISCDIKENPPKKGMLFGSSVLSTENLKKHIVVIDDEVSLTIYLKELLHQHNYIVTTFNDEGEALEYFSRQHNSIDLVITDQSMFTLTGIELSQKMFMIDENVPVIVYSGDVVEIDEIIKSSTRIGSVLHKPLKASKLLETIELLITDT